MTTPRYLDIHVLQTVPFANLNRDDLGSPKSLVYGGATRTRVSSQCWKRAVRLDVERAIGNRAVRTRRVPAEVAARLQARGWSEEAALAAGAQVALSANKKEGLKLEDKGGTSVLLYLPEAALDALADLAAEHREAIEATAGVKKPKAVLPSEQVAKLLSERNGVITCSAGCWLSCPERASTESSRWRTPSPPTRSHPRSTSSPRSTTACPRTRSAAAT